MLSAETPVWAGRLRSSLAALFASAGGHAYLRVSEWPDGFVVGVPGFEQMPSRPHAVMLAAECDPASLGRAAELMLSLDRERSFLAVHGGAPGSQLSPELDARHVVRFALVGGAELASLARGTPPSLKNGPFARTCLGLAQALAAHYRETDA